MTLLFSSSLFQVVLYNFDKVLAALSLSFNVAITWEVHQVELGTDVEEVDQFRVSLEWEDIKLAKMKYKKKEKKRNKIR